MTTNTTTADAIGSSIAIWVKDLFAKYKQYRQIKRTMHELSALGDRELWDMGITRGDIYSVAHGTADLRHTTLDTHSLLEKITSRLKLTGKRILVAFEIVGCSRAAAELARLGYYDEAKNCILRADELKNSKESAL